MSVVDEIDIAINDVVFENDKQERGSWIFCDQTFPRSEIVFIAQTALVFLLVIVSISCLVFAKTCEETTVWVAILSSSVGYMLPAPKP